MITCLGTGRNPRGSVRTVGVWCWSNTPVSQTPHMQCVTVLLDEQDRMVSSPGDWHITSSIPYHANEHCPGLHRCYPYPL
jgi:hypothetical protein